MRRSPIVVLVAVLLSTVSLPISLTGAAVALPRIGVDLDARLAAVQWVVNGYNATFASFMLATGALADLLGRRRMFAAGLVTFAGCGLLSATAGSILLLDGARIFGGIGAAAVATSGSAILADRFDGPARARVFGLFGTTIGAGLAFGPSIAGLLIEAFSWRAVFAAPAIAALLVLVLVPFLPESRRPDAGRIDWPGTASFSTALLLLIFGLVEGPARGWGDPLIGSAFVTGAVLLVVFVAIERRRPAPMFDLHLLANSQFLGICLAAAGIVTVMVPLLVYLPAYLTGVLGQSPGRAGATLILLTAPTLVLPLLAARLTRRVPASVIVVLSVFVVGVGAALLTVLGPASTVAGLAGPLLTMGVGVGLSIGLVDVLAIGSVDPSRAGTVSGMINTARLASETVAIAAVGSVLADTTAGRLAGPGFTTGLHIVLWASAGFAVLVGLLTAVLLRRPATERQAHQPAAKTRPDPTRPPAHCR